MDKYTLGATFPKTFHARLPFSVGELNLNSKILVKKL